MNNIFEKQYQEKLTTADEAVKIVRSGDSIFYSEFVMFPETLDAALARRVNELFDVMITSISFTQVPKPIEVDPSGEHFNASDWHCGVVGRRLVERNMAAYKPITYHQGPRIIKKYLETDVAMVLVAPVDENGYFNFSVVNSVTPKYVQNAKKVIVEVNKSVPVCLGGNSESIHISQVDYIVEGGNSELLNLPVVKPNDTDYQIADHVMGEIEDGACIQLGIGGLPNVVGAKIADSDLKDLGVHTEMLCDSYVDMYEAGKITCLRKNIDKGKMAYSFALGTKKLYDFVDNNPSCASYPVSYTNDPRVIALNDKVIAINNAIEVDLFTQVASETAGTRHISGTGGQLDFIFGAFNSHGGKGMICLSSTFMDKDGNIHSRINPTLSKGAVVTVPRAISHYIVTEYGIAQLKGKSTWERAEAMVNLAHPQFRDELIKEAQAMKIWRRTNKQDV